MNPLTDQETGGIHGGADANVLRLARLGKQDEENENPDRAFHQ